MLLSTNRRTPMRHTDQHRHMRYGQMRVDITTQQCNLPQDELSRMQGPLDRVADAVAGLPAELDVKIVEHPRSHRYHVDASLHLPRRTLFTGDWDAYLDTALNRCLRKLIRKAEAYQAEGDHAADDIAADVEQMNNDIVARKIPTPAHWAKRPAAATSTASASSSP